MRAVLWIIRAPPAFPGGLPVLYFLSRAGLQELPKRLAGLWGGRCLLHARPSGKERVCNCEKQGRPSKVRDFSHKSRVRQSRLYFSSTAVQTSRPFTRIGNSNHRRNALYPFLSLSSQSQRLKETPSRLAEPRVLGKSCSRELGQKEGGDSCPPRSHSVTAVCGQRVE